MAVNTPVLIVSQDTYTAQCLRSQLETSGFEVRVATDGRTALDRLCSEPVALVLIEFVPPPRSIDDTVCAPIDSFQLLRRLRLRSEVGVIMLSRESDEAIKLYFLDSGAEDFVTWPCRYPELALRMRAVMRRAEHRTAI